MSLLIDGYNLLNSVGIVGRGAGASSLERSRLALLNFLAESLDPDEVPRTTVVFDAAHAPPGLPKVVEHRGLTVRFSRGYEDADALIEELIDAETTPRELTVVSSDHRLHRAARRRRARAVDSDVWYAEILRRADRGQSAPALPAKPHVPLSEAEVAQWLERFGGETALREIAEAVEAASSPTATELPTDAPPDDEAADKPTEEEAAAIGDPFPPGYGEDLLDELSEDDSIDLFPPDYGEEDEEG